MQVMKNKKILSNKSNLSNSAKLVLGSVFITNIGNGIHTLTIGKLLYDQTGSTVSFGLVFLAEYVINLLLQVFAGSFVDRGDPKKVLYYSDLIRGVIICIASGMIIFTSPFWWIIFITIAINVAKPFYRSATFTLGPTLAPTEDLLNKFNGYHVSSLQVGQILGVIIAGLILQIFSPYTGLLINGLTFIIAGILILFTNIPYDNKTKVEENNFNLKSIISDWKEVFILLKEKKQLGLLILLSSSDYIVVTFLNLALVPLVFIRFNDNSIWLSVFDGSFALGAILAGSISSLVINKLGKHIIILMSSFGSGTVFILLSYTPDFYIIIPLIMLLGVITTFSFTVFITSIQQQSTGPIKGRIGATRNFSLSLLSLILIPFITFSHDHSLSLGFLASAVICFSFGLLFWILSFINLFDNLEANATKFVLIPRVRKKNRQVH